MLRVLCGTGAKKNRCPLKEDFHVFSQMAGRKTPPDSFGVGIGYVHKLVYKVNPYVKLRNETKALCARYI